MKSFALLTEKSKTYAFDEIVCFAHDEIKSTHRRSDFTSRREISHAMGRISPTRKGGFN